MLKGMYICMYRAGTEGLLNMVVSSPYVASIVFFE